jgi:hypothetical protein
MADVATIIMLLQGSCACDVCLQERKSICSLYVLCPCDGLCDWLHIVFIDVDVIGTCSSRSCTVRVRCSHGNI